MLIYSSWYTDTHSVWEGYSSQHVLAHKVTLNGFFSNDGKFGFPNFSNSCQQLVCYRSPWFLSSLNHGHFQKWQKVIWAPLRLAKLLEGTVG